MEWRLVKPKRFQKLVAPIVTQEGRKSKGAFVGLGVRSLPFRVGQHIVCIDSWSGAAPKPPSGARCFCGSNKARFVHGAPHKGDQSPLWYPPTFRGDRNEKKFRRYAMKKDKMFAMRMSTADYDRIQNKAQLSGMTMLSLLKIL